METTELAKLLELPDTDSDGHLVLTNQNLTWSLTVIQGRLLYAVDGLHAIRRWNRSLEKNFPNCSWDTQAVQPVAQQPWQIQWLDKGVNQQKLSLIRTKLMIRTIIQECLFELSLCGQLHHEWRPDSLPVSRISRSLALSTWEIQMTLNKVKEMRQQWQGESIAKITPVLSPILKKPIDSKRLPVGQPYLTGNFTLWDIATKLDKPLVDLAKSLVPLGDDGTLEFQPIADLPATAIYQPVSSGAIAPPKSAPKSFSTPATAPKPRRPAVVAKPPAKSGATLPDSNSTRPLVACIDDSPVLAHSLKKILASGGYRTLIIQEPMQGFSQLIEYRPGLILLDVMLPHTDGYNICRFLRDTPVFEKTPIIILTGRSKPVDRARASMAGATEFLVKPPEPDALLKMIHKHLGTGERISS
ncbi:MAG: response regulator [Cyanobacteria bacterium P01_A01_bin.15]